MTISTLRALATALLISTGIAVVAVTITPSAVEAGVRPAVGAALNEAIRAAGSGNASLANEKIRQAESVGNLTPGEQQAIEQTKQYVGAKTGSGGGATGARAKFANDYNAGRYSSVVGEDADELRKTGGLTGEDEVVIAQAYYLMHDYSSCIRHVRDMGHGSEQVLELLNRCAYEAHDTDAQQSALEELVVDYGQPKYWSDLLDNADRTSSLSNADTLDIYRLRLLTGTMKGESDYETATEIAIQLGSPTEAVTFATKGVDAKSPRGARLIALAKAQAATDAAALPKAVAAANAAKSGDANLKLGEDYWGMGRYQDAVTAIKAAIAKGVSTPDEAQIRLAMAYIGLKDRSSALHALAQVSKTAPAHTQTVAKLWSIYARTH
jgi:tetratricopeptide (TPR) repeat protein